MTRSLVRLAVVLSLGLNFFVATALAQAAPLRITPLAERKVNELPAGELFWRIENLPTLSAAQAAAGPWALAAESAGKVWLFTLGAAGGSTPGATKDLLRINQANGAPGSMTAVHSHPGSEAFFVLSGEQSIRGPHGIQRVQAGQPEPGHGADMPMQVSSSGSTDLHALVMFVVDATRPFSSPAQLP
jgi:hypothetical protein